jgi:hypothetical protein
MSGGAGASGTAGVGANVGGASGAVGGGPPACTEYDCSPAGCLPPPPGPDPAAPDADPAAKPIVLVADRFFVGDTDWAGTPSVCAWANYGADLDALAPGSFGRCKASSPLVGEDGPKAQDNSFGRIVVPFLRMNINFASDEFSLGAEHGSSSMAMRIHGLAEAQSYRGLLIEVFSVGDASGTVFADMKWPPRFESVLSTADPANYQAAVQFSHSYLVGGLLVSGPSPEELFSLTLDAEFSDTLGPMRWTFPIRRPMLLMTLSADRRRVTRGWLVGAIRVDDLLASWCVPGHPNPDWVVKAIGDAADTSLSGSSDAEQACDSISFAIGFEAAASGLGDPLEDYPHVECPLWPPPALVRRSEDDERVATDPQRRRCRAASSVGRASHWRREKDAALDIPHLPPVAFSSLFTPAASWSREERGTPWPTRERSSNGRGRTAR